MQQRFDVTIVKVQRNTRDVATIHFLVNGKPLVHQAGQYITVYFDDTDVREGKAYSLSSAPGDQTSSITVKKVGLFSGKLHQLRPGDTMSISLPYGSFNAYKQAPIVAIASGVGISPIWSIVRDESMRQTGRPIKLFYSNKTLEDVIFHDEIEQLVASKRVSCEHFITRNPESPYVNRRIDPVDDASQYAEDHCYYVCGTTEFVRDMWRGLVGAGVPESSISTETFFGAPA